MIAKSKSNKAFKIVIGNKLSRQYHDEETEKSII